MLSSTSFHSVASVEVTKDVVPGNDTCKEHTRVTVRAMSKNGTILHVVSFFTDGSADIPISISGK